MALYPFVHVSALELYALSRYPGNRQNDWRSFRNLTGSPYIYVGFYFERKLRFLLAFSLTAIWSVLFSSLYDELCWWYLFQTQYAVSTMITFYTYRVVVAKSVRTVLQGTNRTRRPKWTASAFAVTKNFRTSVPIYYFALQKMRHKPASTKDLELCARSIPQLWAYKITTRIMIINHHVQIPHSAAAAVTAIVEGFQEL